MGLDMYLRARAFASEYYCADHYPALQALADQIGLPSFTGLRSITMSTDAAYWRKANQIHAWFVDHVQEGEDNCRQYFVTFEQLQELHDLCARLLIRRDGAEALESLPPHAGFFFGSTDLDEYYWQDLEHTVEQLARLFAHPGVEQFDFTYQSSW